MATKTDPGFWSGDSPWVVLIRHRHERSRLHQWDNNRVNSTCQHLGVDVYTLCALCGLTNRSRVQSLLRRRKCWPMELTVQFLDLEHRALNMVGPTPKDALLAQVLSVEKPEKVA